jgi:hypothetical protein
VTTAASLLANVLKPQDAQAINMYMSILLPGLNDSDLSKCAPAHVPPPAHLAIISTLAIHPSYTTRTPNADKHAASALAIQYLNLVTRLVGPVNSSLAKAYRFPTTGEVTRRRTTVRRREGDLDKENKEGIYDEGVLSELAGSGSVWANAGDFWAAVGWAFNCSVAHKKRWERWRLWLEHMVDVLERDWEIHEHNQTVDESLLVSYVRGGDVKRTMRAIFARGGREGAEFHEVWKHELRERKARAVGFSGERAKVTVDVESGQFGDYFNDSDASEDEEEPVPGAGETATEALAPQPGPEDNVIDTIALDASAPLVTALPDGTLPLGGSAALHLRARLLSLLSKLSCRTPPDFVDLATFADHVLTHVRPLPTLAFVTLLSPAYRGHFELHVNSFVLQCVAGSFVESAAPPPPSDDLDQAVLERSYLPWAANTVGPTDNAKLSACVEYLARLAAENFGGQLSRSKGLQDALEKGIKRREDKAARSRGRKGEAGGGGRDVDGEWLRASGRRLRVMVMLAKTEE